MMLFIQETRLNMFDSRTIVSLGGLLLTKGVGVDSVGSVGGLLTLWNENLFKAHSCISNKMCIIVAGELINAKKEVVLYNVYASNNEMERRPLWNFIVVSHGSPPMPWCIGEDFNTILNTILYTIERKGGTRNTCSIRSFNNFILRAKVIDLQVQGSAYIRSNWMEKASWARLDLFLISHIILSWIPKLIQISIPYSLSDHRAISLGEPSVDWGPSLFRFYNRWLEDKEIMGNVKGGWKERKVLGSQGFTLFSKVKAVKKIEGLAVS
ncbi:hypothetical protein Dsin_013577 [Dipteronia sinensis]|uniref:Reverse transcriptase n=1 Tax=Dipteronia sinensis TaxID=43782 RepID=A0AAE0E9K2_9ROSI|nr:hypothetical protein Dsin_013577 [Dipteronia sinensis]